MGPSPARLLPRRLRRPGLRSLGLRGQVVALAASVAVLVGVVLVLVLQLVLDLSTSSTVDRVLTDRSAAVIASVQATSSAEAGLVVPEALLDPGVVVYDEDGTRVAGSVPPSLKKVFAELSEETATRQVDLGDHYSVLATPFDTDAGQAVLVVSEPRAPYESEEGVAFVVSATAAVVLVLLAAGVAAWASGRALAPVADMARTAEKWSEHELHRRFDLGAPTNEIRALGHTLDALLERVAQAILAEQRLTAELAHELRTPLTSLQVTAELAAARNDLDEQLREDLDDILLAARTMGATITVLLDVARAQASGLDAVVPARQVLEDAVRRYVLTAATTLDLPDGLVLDVPHELAVRALAPVLANADRHGSQVVVTATVEPGRVHLDVADDGTGVDADVAADLFTPGRSGSGGAGLGLPLARRVARSAGGDVLLRPGPDGARERGGAVAGAATGAVFRVTLPGRASVREP
ncbi:sensor histidine kinase [Nocardioides bruguierae]|uniref:histidine kinase n=1 Tax=Nocardioides bruguierae TaxID=2945102 RepID=A0A9X2IF35_9ACTN|nr:sensor histidine kinase [Nocardioides bruguierae]MCM0619285.1 sensor histidine kinase [Nocardioides bruguierae]